MKLDLTKLIVAGALAGGLLADPAQRRGDAQGGAIWEILGIIQGNSD